MHHLLPLARDGWEVGNEELREVNPSLLQQFSCEVFCCAIVPSMPLLAVLLVFQDPPVVLEVASCDVFDRLMCPGLVLDAVGIPLPLQFLIPFPSSEVAMGFSSRALTTEPVVTINTKMLPCLRLVGLLSALQFLHPLGLCLFARFKRVRDARRPL